MSFMEFLFFFILDSPKKPTTATNLFLVPIHAMLKISVVNWFLASFFPHSQIYWLYTMFVCLLCVCFYGIKPNNVSIKKMSYKLYVSRVNRKTFFQGICFFFAPSFFKFLNTYTETGILCVCFFSLLVSLWLFIE